VGTGSYGLEPPGALVHVDIDPDALGRNHPADVALACDAKAFMDALLAGLGAESRGEDAVLRERIRVGHARVWEEWLGDVGGARVTPAHLLHTAQRVYGPDTVYTTDSGNGTFLAMECLRLERPRRYLAPVDYSCMGYAVPGAIGAKLACPDVLVLRDRELAQIAQFQATAMNRKVASEVHDYVVGGLAGGMGVASLSLDHDDDVERVLVEADRLARDGRPVLVDVAIDYSRKTWFTRGVVKANLHRLPLKDQVRFVGRALLRKVTG
jgi:acetolactate synthase-1/2/3 large subunit